MDSFDHKVTRMERDILEIKNNIDCMKSKNHKTIYSIVESINSLSKNKSKKKNQNKKKKDELSSTKNTLNSKDSNKENINQKSNNTTKLNYRNQNCNISLNKQFFLNNKNNSHTNYLEKNYSTANLKSNTLHEDFSKTNNKNSNENLNKTNLKINYFNSPTTLKYNTNRNKNILDYSINYNNENNNDLNKGYLYKKYQNNKSITLKERNENSSNIDFINNQTFDIFQKSKKKEEYNNSKEISYNDNFNYFQKQRNNILDISENQKNSEFQTLYSPKIYSNLKKIFNCNTRNIISHNSQSFQQKSPRSNSAYQRQRLNPFHYKRKNNSASRNNSYEYNNHYLNKDNEKYKKNNFFEQEYNSDEEKDNLLLNQIKKILNLKNNNDIINKILEFKKYEELYEEIKKLFSTKYRIDKDLNNETLLNWVNELNQTSIYYNYCQKIMNNYNIHSFDELKNFLDEFFMKKKRNENFVDGMKKILCSNYFKKNKVVQK